MNHVGLLLLSCLVVSASCLAVAPVKEVKAVPAKIEKVSKDYEEPEPEPEPEPPGTIGETDSIIENLLGFLDKLTINIENLHVGIDIQPNINIQINMGDLFAPLFNFLGRLFGAHEGPSSAEVLARIEQGFKLIDARLAAFEARLDRLFDELRLVIQLALYHPIRTDIHLLLSELHATLRRPSRDAVARFVTKCTLNDPLDNLFRVYRLVDEKVTAELLPSISRAAAYDRTTFLKFGRMFLSDGSLAGLLTSACDAFSKTKPPRRQRALSLMRSTAESLKAHLVRTYTTENRQLVDHVRNELRDQVNKHSGSGSNAVIASRAHAFFRSKYPYTQQNWGVVVFQKRSVSGGHASWVLPGHVGQGLGVEMVDEVAGRIALLHIIGENHRDNNWENRVRDSIQHVQVANNPIDPNEVLDIFHKKLGDTQKGFVVLVRYELEARIDSLSDVVHDREVCVESRTNRNDDCIKWVFMLGKN